MSPSKSQSGLQVAADLALPVDTVVQSIAVLGKRGRGKTYTAKRIVEQVLAAGVPVAVIDPTDVWHGVRTGADGNPDGGLDVVVFGGRNGDLPLNEHAGKMLARLFLDGTSMVLVTKSLPKAARRRFVAEFLTELYDNAVGNPLLVVVDEADEYAPQGTFGQVEVAKCLGAMEDLVRRGRAGGLGTLLISQRPAVLNKDVLEQVDVLVVLGLTGKNDIAAIDNWVGKHASDDEAAKELERSLPGLPQGTAWIWAPELGILQKVAVLPISTFDSSRSPKVGETVVVPIRRKAIDLQALGEEIAQFTKEVEATDPRHLRNRIAELERQLAETRATVPEPLVERVEVPALASEVVEEVVELSHRLEDTALAFRRGLEILEATKTTQLSIRPIASGSLTISREAVEGSSGRNLVSEMQDRHHRRAMTTSTNSQSTSPDETDKLGKAERQLLTVLAQHGPRTHAQLALQAGYSPTTSTIGVALGKLRRLGYVESGQPVTATQAGIAALGGLEPMPTGRELLNYWLNKLGKAERLILEAMLAKYPNEFRMPNLAESIGYSPTTSTVGVALGKLRRLELVEGWKISDAFAGSIR